jgi:hypothetical protein
VSARLLAIDARRKPFSVAPAAPGDFDTHETAKLAAERILDDPTLSLYCVDPERHELLFVRTPPEVDLLQAPFLYVTQYEAAIELVAVPVETALALADSVAFDASRLVVVYSVGRCGSTFVSAALGAVEGSASLSEPDVFFGLHALVDRGVPGAEALVRASTILLCAPRPASVWAVKLRSHEIELAPILRAAFPQAKSIFLYRDAESWARSAARAFRLFEPETVAGWGETKDIFPRVRTLADGARPLEAFADPVELLAWLWATSMLRGLEVAQGGGFSFVARYTELAREPRPVLEALLRACGVEADPAALDAVVARDSQEGTQLSRASAQATTSELTEPRREAFLRRLAAIAPGLAPGTELPGTFVPA